MFNILLFVACFAKQGIEYTTIGVVDRYENGICVIEIYEKEYDEYLTVFMKSENCKDGDIIAIGRQNENR